MSDELIHAVFLRDLKKRLRRIRRRTKALARDCRQEEIHRLRVDLKQLRAQLRLLRSVDPAFPYREVYAPYKALFAAAGAVRFWQLQAGILGDTPQLPPEFAPVYRGYVKKRLRAALKAFRQTAARPELTSWSAMRQEIRTAAEQCTPANVAAYFDLLRDAVLEKSQHPKRRRKAELHELRKQLKEYANNRRLAVKHLDFDPGAPLRLPAGAVDFDELLGQWHDLDAACTQLDADLRGENWGKNAMAGGRIILETWRTAERELWDRICRYFAR